MNKFWLIASHEYSRHVFRRRFLLALFSVPLIMVFMVVLIIVIIRINSNPTPIGYIDHSGLLANSIPQPAPKWPERMVPMQAYTDEANAKADLQAGKLQAYYIIPEDYLQSGQAQEIYLKEPDGMAIQQFDSFLTANLLSTQPAEIANRIVNGSNIIVQSTDKSREASQENFINILLPILAGVLFHRWHEYQLRLSDADRGGGKRKPHHGDHGHFRFSRAIDEWKGDRRYRHRCHAAPGLGYLHRPCTDYWEKLFSHAGWPQILR